jgi:hypothetical protein
MFLDRTVIQLRDVMIRLSLISESMFLDRTVTQLRELTQLNLQRNKQDEKNAYNVTLRRVHATVVAVEKQ